MTRSTALQAMARAQRWALATLAERQRTLGAEQAATAQQLQAQEQELIHAAGQQHTLLAGASFSANALVSRRLAFAALAGEAARTRQHSESLATQAESLATDLCEHRHTQAVLDRVLARRNDTDTHRQNQRTQRDMDELVASRTGR